MELNMIRARQLADKVNRWIRDNVANSLLVKLYRRKLLITAARKSFKHFVRYMVPDFTFSDFNLKLIRALRDAYEWKNTKILVNMPPRHGKTMLVNELFPAWVLGNKPDERFVNAGYSVTLAKESSARCLWYVTDPKFKNVFPNFVLDHGKTSVREWKTYSAKNPRKKGGYYAVGTGGSLTGRWFTYGIVDDPTKDREMAESITYRKRIVNWFTSTFLTRKQVTRKPPDKIVVIVVMTRWHVDDLTGHIEEMMRVWKEKYDRYVKLAFPAIDDQWNVLFPEKFTLADYEKIRESVGPRDWEALYMRNPVKSMGAIFVKENYKYFYRSDFDKAGSALKKGDCVWGLHVDPAFSTSKNSDSTVIALVGLHKHTKEYYLRDISGDAISPSVAYVRMFRMLDSAKMEGINVSYISVERVAINRNRTLFKRNLVEYMRRNGKIYTLIDFCPHEDKVSRVIGALEGKFRRWMIRFLNKNDSTWNTSFKTLEDELMKFPSAAHDDFPDALARAIVRLPHRLSMIGGAGRVERKGKRRSIDPYTWREIRI